MAHPFGYLPEGRRLVPINYHPVVSNLGRRSLGLNSTCERPTLPASLYLYILPFIRDNT